MSHEITSTDDMVLHKTAAWHGLGNVVETAPTPGQALTLANLDWSISERSIITAPVDSQDYHSDRPITTHKALQRSDNGEILSVVGSEYTVLQNQELAEFCYELADEGDVTVESAGSLKGGKRIWFLLKSETLCIGRDEECDEIAPYVLCYNSHDGSSSVEFMPTTIRVVCNNTLSLARRKSDSRSFKFRHTVNMRNYMTAAVQEMRNCFLEIEQWGERMNQLASIDLNKEKRDDYWDKVFKAISGPTPKDDKARERRAKKQENTITEWAAVYNREVEADDLRPTPWLAFNAVTNWIDHQSRVHLTGRTSHDTLDEARDWSNLFGRNAKRKETALAIAADTWINN